MRACVDACPEVFEMNEENVAVAKLYAVPADAEATCSEAAESCPVDAINLKA